MTSMTTTERDRGVTRTLFAVALVGLVATGGAFFVSGARAGISVGIGAIVGALNLWVMSIVVRGLTSQAKSSVPWGLVAVLKFAVLIAGLFLLIKSGSADVLALLIGYGSLPLGIAAAHLGVPRAAHEEG